MRVYVYPCAAADGSLRVHPVEGQDAAAAAAKSEAASDNKPTEAKKAQDKSFLTQALAIVRAKKWQVYQGHVSTQVALGGSNFVYFFWYVCGSALLARLFYWPCH